MGEVRKENIKYIIWKYRRQGCGGREEGHETIWREPRDSDGFLNRNPMILLHPTSPPLLQVSSANQLLSLFVIL